MKNFNDLFIHELKEVFNIENQLIEALPEMAKAAHCKDLKEAFHGHLKETREQLERLNKIGKELGLELSGVESEAMKMMIKEGNKVIHSSYPHEVKDAALISCAQRVEHYELAVYGTLKSFAKHLKFKEIEKLLDESSKEEGNADKKLTDIAAGTLFHCGVNAKAVNQC